jgi:hypothetical protein
MYELIIHVDVGDGNIEERRYTCSSREEAESMLKLMQRGAPIFAYDIVNKVCKGDRCES